MTPPVGTDLCTPSPILNTLYPGPSDSKLGRRKTFPEWEQLQISIPEDGVSEISRKKRINC